MYLTGGKINSPLEIKLAQRQIFSRVLVCREECPLSEGHAGDHLPCGTAEMRPPGVKCSWKGGCEARNCTESVYVCLGRMATHHTPLTGLAC